MLVLDKIVFNLLRITQLMFIIYAMTACQVLNHLI